MKRKKFKFASKRGASVLIALLVFFLAALSGTIALTMAASNAGTYTHKAEDQQRYLSVASAARLILSRLEDVTVHFKANANPHSLKDKAKDDDIIAAVIGVEYDGGNYTDLFLNDDDFKDYLKRYSVQDVIVSPQTMKPIGFSFSVSGAPKMGTTHVNMTANGAIFQFKFWFQGENGAQDYQMTMQVTARYGKAGETGEQAGWQDSSSGLCERHLTFITDIGEENGGVTFIVESNVKPQEGG